MKLELEGHIAYSAVQTQLQEYHDNIAAALKHANMGEWDKAYKIFPFHSSIGANIEAVVASRPSP